jgi:hypothetical protein
VRKELRAALTLEVERDRDVILPVILDSVRVPLFLRDKKYADFSGDFRRGISDLLDAFGATTRAGTPIELETTRCTVLLDVLCTDGSRVAYKKTQTVRCRAAEARSYVEARSPDGEVRDFRVRPGTITRVWRESGTVHVETAFSKPLRRGESATRGFSCLWVNSFCATSEYWDERQHHPSRNVAIVVRFPRSRPPKTWDVQEREGAILRTSSHKARLVEMKGKPALRLFVRTPHLFRSYILRWNW